MMALGAMATNPADVAFFSPPPNRPDRPERRTSGRAQALRSVLDSFRRELEQALEAGNGFPRVRSYPY
jgi:hypothetical protein